MRRAWTGPGAMSQQGYVAGFSQAPPGVGGYSNVYGASHPQAHYGHFGVPPQGAAPTPGKELSWLLRPWSCYLFLVCRALNALQISVSSYLCHTFHSHFWMLTQDYRGNTLKSLTHLLMWGVSLYLFVYSHVQGACISWIQHAPTPRDWPVHDQWSAQWNERPKVKATLMRRFKACSAYALSDLSHMDFTPLGSLLLPQSLLHLPTLSPLVPDWLLRQFPRSSWPIGWVACKSADMVGSVAVAIFKTQWPDLTRRRYLPLNWQCASFWKPWFEGFERRPTVTLTKGLNSKGLGFLSFDF